MKNIIVAYDRNRAIGRDNELLWQSGEMREDMARFRTLTRQATVIMGRKTLESIGVALPQRRNIVITRNSDFSFPGIETARTVDDAFSMSESQETFVIGGAQIYTAAVERVDRIYATEVQAVIEEADAFFTELDDTWVETSRDNHAADDRNIYPYDFVTYERQSPRTPGASTNFVNMANARFDSQRAVMETIANKAECPFCDGNLEKYHTKEILRKGEHWLLTPNQWPYEHTETHLLAIPTYHAETLAELRPGSFDELLEHMQWAEREYDVRAGGIAMRFGNPKFNGASVTHLHAHMIVPSRDKPADVKVRFKIS